MNFSGHVVSFLPTRCAVRTSILSTKWRHIFTLTSCLSFDDKPWFRGPRVIATAPEPEESFRKFVYYVLELHKISPIKKFSLVCRGTYDKSDLNAWVTNVVRKGVQEIHYEVGEKRGVPDDLVMCETLMTLKMVSDGRYNIKIPLSVSLPNLKILHLDYIDFVNYGSMQRLLSACKLLEELTLEFCECFKSDIGDHVIISAGLLKVLTIEGCSFEDGLFEIDAPNLAHLAYDCIMGMKIAPSWKYSCSLVNAKLKFHCYHKVSLVYDREILKAAAYKTTELHLLANSIEVLLIPGDQEEMPDFYNLSRLHLCNFPYESWKYVIILLDKSPQLETVVFERGLHRCYCDREYPPCEPLFPFSCHAQVIEVRDFCGHMGALLHLRHLLKNARVLKKLILHKCRFEDKLKNDLLMLPRASSDCCIELKEGNK
ncbi:F-box/LRR-repeat protein At4g14103-like [Silene latifolia]|uniref:F-box/LRR-repeat protein At4g14103-like n=1 Tax=Silene latifolia TaxID=37657 RepID=UPI003D785EE3